MNGCWPWQGSIGADGYGRVYQAGSNRLAHRVVYEMMRGPVPDGLQLDHLCRVRHCCNPAHLEPVTQRENILRGRAPAAVNAAKARCVNGHPFDEVRSDGSRRCKTCKNERARRYRLKVAV